jgi:hypothetical protein
MTRTSGPPRSSAPLRQEITAREHDLQKATADTARRLTRAGWSVRDAAVMLRITPGRVSQLNHR